MESYLTAASLYTVLKAAMTMAIVVHLSTSAVWAIDNKCETEKSDRQRGFIRPLSQSAAFFSSFPCRANVALISDGEIRRTQLRI